MSKGSKQSNSTTARHAFTTYGDLGVCGVSTSFLILMLGIACLVVSAIGYFFKIDGFACGQNGKPPLREWVLGTGIGFSIISIAFYRVSQGDRNICWKWILGVANLFVLIWACVGVYSLFKYDFDCKEDDPTLWNMAWAGVTVSFMVFCCGGFVGYNVHTAQVVVVHERDRDLDIA